MKIEVIVSFIFLFVCLISAVICLEEVNSLHPDSSTIDTLTTEGQTTSKVFTARTVDQTITQKISTKKPHEENKSTLTVGALGTVSTLKSTLESIGTSTEKNNVADDSSESVNTKFDKNKNSGRDDLSKHPTVEDVNEKRKQNENGDLDLPFYTIIAASVAVALAALVITAVVIWKASKRSSIKSRMSNLDQRNLNNIELCTTSKTPMYNLKMSFGGIPPDNEIWREIKSSTPTVF